MAWYDVLSSIVDFGAKLFNTGYSLYQDNRDFQYQKDLQQDIFNREDTAVQRRMADLTDSGLNPNLAAGSAASAGAAVGRSNSKNVELGSMLDTMSAMNQIQLQRQEKANKEEENKILKAQKTSSQLSAFLQEYDLYNALGFNPKPFVYSDGNGNLRQRMYVDSGYATGLNLLDLQREFNIQNLSNSAKMLQLDTDFYESNKWLKTILPVLNILGQGGSNAANIIKAFK